MNIPVEKNEHYTIDIIDIGVNGEGIGKIDNFTLFVPGAVTQDKVEVKILKVKKNFAYAKLTKLIQASSYRTEPACRVANQCGGCQLQHISYTEQLAWKTKKVKDALEHIGGLKEISVNQTLGMENPKHYRNKAQYPIRKEDGKIKIGFFAARSHRIVPSDKCTIEHEGNRDILEIVEKFLNTYDISVYDEEKHKGLVRHLVIKTAYFTTDKMVVLAINGKSLPHQDSLVEALKRHGVTSIILSHNIEKTNVVLHPHITVIYGKDYIIDKIGDLSFKISPLAFFQVNPLQTKVLYDKALEYADLKGNETVWDAYCGIGTISLFLAQKAKQVYGVEIVEEAIINANANAKLNEINNAEFYVGKAEEVIPTLYQEENITADVIVVDPPRKGCDEKLLETLVKMAPQKIVYVSCDPGTLARDLKYLCQEGYTVEKVQPVDMFPETTHVECCVSLVRKKD